MQMNWLNWIELNNDKLFTIVLFGHSDHCFRKKKTSKDNDWYENQPKYKKCLKYLKVASVYWQLIQVISDKWMRPLSKQICKIRLETENLHWKV